VNLASTFSRKSVCLTHIKDRKDPSYLGLGVKSWHGVWMVFWSSGVWLFSLKETCVICCIVFDVIGRTCLEWRKGVTTGVKDAICHWQEKQG
jgi:hypothetical protein